MSTESSRNQNILWWIASIATSVLCCSILFVLFASYIVDVKKDLEDSSMRLSLIEKREDRILSEMELLLKHMAVKVNNGEIRPAAEAPAPDGAGGVPVGEPGPGKTPENPPNGAPSAPAPAASPGGPPSITPPSMPVPLAPAPADEK